MVCSGGSGGGVEWGGDIQERLNRFVDRLKPPIRSPAVERAFRRVPRHVLVPRFYVADQDSAAHHDHREVVFDPDDPKPFVLDFIYSDRVLVTRFGPDGTASSSSSMPSLMANMLEHLQLERGHKVLEIGAGTGYNAALLAEIVGSQSRVVTVDIQPDVVEETRRRLQAAGYGGIKIVCRDGFFGAADEAPFDRIIATVGLFDISPHWGSQLTPEGVMLVPLFQGGLCPLLRINWKGGSLSARVVGMSGFMPVQGEMHPTGGTRREDRRVPHEKPRIERRTGWSLSPRERWALWFYITAADGRGSLLSVPGKAAQNTWEPITFGLSDGKSNAVIIDADEVVLVGDSEPLLERLVQLYSKWDEAGRPKETDFRIEVVRKGGYVPNPEDLAVERRYHWYVLRLRDGEEVGPGS